MRPTVSRCLPTGPVALLGALDDSGGLPIPSALSSDLVPLGNGRLQRFDVRAGHGIARPQCRIFRRAGMSYPGARNLVEGFVEMGILAEAPTKRRPRLFFAPRILDLVGG